MELVRGLTRLAAKSQEYLEHGRLFFEFGRARSELVIDVSNLALDLSELDAQINLRGPEEIRQFDLGGRLRQIAVKFDAMIAALAPPQQPGQPLPPLPQEQWLQPMLQRANEQDAAQHYQPHPHQPPPQQYQPVPNGYRPPPYPLPNGQRPPQR